MAQLRSPEPHSMCWRGDGAEFSLSSTQPDGKLKRVRMGQNKMLVPLMSFPKIPALEG